jgi:hypothetical protein
MQKLFTVRMLAELFQKHENTIYLWITIDRLLPNAFQIKGGWYVPESDVKHLMRSRRQPAEVVVPSR